MVRSFLSWEPTSATGSIPKAICLASTRQIQPTSSTKCSARWWDLTSPMNFGAFSKTTTSPAATWSLSPLPVPTPFACLSTTASSPMRTIWGLNLPKMALSASTVWSHGAATMDYISFSTCTMHPADRRATTSTTAMVTPGSLRASKARS